MTDVATTKKEEGNSLYSSGDYEGAIQAFGLAIAASNDKSFLKVCYSNRSAANLQLKRNEDALVDAKKCIEIDPQWKKGHIRLGDAEYEKKKYTESYNAYQAAKRLDVNDKSLDDKLEQAMRGIRNGASSTSSSQGRTSGGGSSIVQPGGIVGKIMQYTRYLIIVSAIFYLVPFFPHGWSYLCYKSFAVLAAGLYVVQLYTKHGFPKFSTDYLQLVLPDPYAMYLFMSAILCISKPYMSAIGPIFFLEMSNLSGDFFSYLQKNKALVDAQVKPMIDKYAPSMSHMTAEMSSPRMMQKVNFALLRNAALSQVLHGIYLIVELILPSRNLMTCVVWWQFLQMHYMVLQDTPNLPFNHLKEAFEAVHQKISSVVNHRLCPKLVSRGYTMLTKMLADRVKRPQQQQAPTSAAGGLSGLMSKCTIM